MKRWSDSCRHRGLLTSPPFLIKSREGAGGHQSPTDSSVKGLGEAIKTAVRPHRFHNERAREGEEKRKVKEKNKRWIEEGQRRKREKAGEKVRRKPQGERRKI